MPLQGLALGWGHPLPKKAWRRGHVSNPLGFWILPQLSDWVKRGFSTFFFIWPRSAVWLCPPPLPGLGGLGRSSPGAGASTSALAIFTRQDHERASDLSQGTLPLGGGQSPASVPGVPVRLRSGCFPAVSAAAAAGEEGFGGAACGVIEKEN